ncbi:MAG: hypothetical protein AMJ75_00760 [Phycisphaerae bacterium SM1_79]|nr:MAG: hypothetical protein AMJ75_00760 [Phycisphaerae bacterium SM1_79]
MRHGAVDKRRRENPEAGRLSSPHERATRRKRTVTLATRFTAVYYVARVWLDFVPTLVCLVRWLFMGIEPKAK